MCQRWWLEFNLSVNKWTEISEHCSDAGSIPFPGRHFQQIVPQGINRKHQTGHLTALPLSVDASLSYRFLMGRQTTSSSANMRSEVLTVAEWGRSMCRMQDETDAPTSTDCMSEVMTCHGTVERDVMCWRTEPPRGEHHRLVRRDATDWIRVSLPDRLCMQDYTLAVKSKTIK